jgi:hypothetical protein
MPFNEDGSRKAAYKKSGFKMKGWSAGEGTGSSFKKDPPEEKKYKPSDPQSDAFWEPGGMYQTMTERGYKWDGTNFVKK